MVLETDCLGLNAGSFTYYLRYHYFASPQTNIDISSVSSEDTYLLSTHQILAIILFFSQSKTVKWSWFSKTMWHLDWILKKKIQ